MTRKKISSIKVSLTAVILIILSVATMIASYWMLTEDPNNYIHANSVVISRHFSETGNLVKNNPGMEKNTWYLLYDKPGGPASSIKLSFSQNSLCELSIKEEVCQISKLRLGERVKIIGNLKGGAVNVQSLTIVK